MDVLIAGGVVLSMYLSRKGSDINNIVKINETKGKEEQNEVGIKDHENNCKTKDEILK